MCASPTGRTASSIRGAREARRKVRLPGEHGISRPTTAQGRPSDWRHLYAAVRFFCVCFSRSGPRVPVGTRPSLRPLGSRGWSDEAKLGRNAPRGCEGVSGHTLLSSSGSTGRSSIPEAIVIESRGCGVLDSRLRGNDRRVRASHSALVPRTQRSVPSTVRCRAGAHVAALYRVASGSRLCAATLRVAARPGHETSMTALQPLIQPPPPAPSPPTHWTRTAVARSRSPRRPWSRTAPRG